MAKTETTWTGSLHLTFRLLPVSERSSNLGPFLNADQQTPQQLITNLPYDTARAAARGSTTGQPDARRYRDGKQVYQTAGLLYEDNAGIIHVTELGIATRRWLSLMTPKNAVILARHAAYALAACQLRNPTGAGQRYSSEMIVFPFQFIWRAMLKLDGYIGSDELNRAIFKVKNEDELESTIALIIRARERNDITILGEEVITGRAKNDRIIPWMALASFGWTLFPDKRRGDQTGNYTLIPETLSIIREASRIQHKHRNFSDTEGYVEYISSRAALPKDLR